MFSAEQFLKMFSTNDLTYETSDRKEHYMFLRFFISRLQESVLKVWHVRVCWRMEVALIVFLRIKQWQEVVNCIWFSFCFEKHHLLPSHMPSSLSEKYFKNIRFSENRKRQHIACCDFGKQQYYFWRAYRDFCLRMSHTCHTKAKSNLCEPITEKHVYWQHRKST